MTHIPSLTPALGQDQATTEAAVTPERTTQLRRYRLVPRLSGEFVPWWQTKLVPAREAYGFRVEFATFQSKPPEFVWAVSVVGDRERFDAIEQSYLGSPERAAAFADAPDWVQRAWTGFVEFVSPAPDRR